MKEHKVISNVALTGDTTLLSVENSGISCRPGQCFSLGLADLKVNREYSIYSGKDAQTLDFLIRRVEGGVVSPALFDVKAGDHVQLGGPYGEFCIDRHSLKDNKFVFISTGTGVAPFHSFIRSYEDLDYQLYFGVREDDELYQIDHYEAGRVVSCISNSKSQPRRRVTTALMDAKLDQNALYYLCGNRNMITDAVKIMKEKGIPGGNIFMETFF